MYSKKLLHGKITQLNQFLILGMGVLATLFVYLSSTPRDGLENLFLIPMTFTVCFFFFGDLLKLHKGSIGFKIFYSIVLLKYIVSPILITQTRNLHFMRRVVDPSSYQMAILIISLELFLACVTIRTAWSYYQKYPPRKKNIVDKPNLSSLAWLVCLILVLISILRFDRFISGVNFLFLSKSTSELGSFEGISLLVIKSFVFIRVLIYSKRKYYFSKKKIWLLLALAFSIINMTVFYGDNRSLVFQTAVVTIYVLTETFPEYRKKVLFALLPLAILTVLSMTLVRHFNYNITEFENLGANIDLQYISETIEMYTNGVWPIGSAIDAANELGKYTVSLGTVLSDFSMNFFPFFIPIINGIRTIGSYYPSTTQLYNYATGNVGSMLPLSGQMWFYGGNYFGLLLTSIANIIVIFYFVKFEVISKYSKSIQYKYLYTWLSTLFGFIMCYTLITLLWSWSKYGLLLSLLYFVNRITTRTHYQT